MNVCQICLHERKKKMTRLHFINSILVHMRFGVSTSEAFSLMSAPKMYMQTDYHVSENLIRECRGRGKLCSSAVVLSESAADDLRHPLQYDK